MSVWRHWREQKNTAAMIYENTISAKFISRPNRFVAYVEIDGKEEKVHVKNTGRCRELLIPGATVILERASNLNRKTQYDLIAVYKKDFGLINIDSQAPNKVVMEWLQAQGYEYIKPEYTYGKSRMDFYMEKNGKRYLMEVKGCTLEVGGIGYFPDAPTLRGAKHLHELTKAIENGYRSILAFVIQMEGVTEVLPNVATDPEFAKALEEARNAGVEILFLQTIVHENSLKIITNI